MRLFVGHDLGTSGNKAALVDESGRVLRTHVSSFSLQHPGPGQAEQDPADWWAAVCEGTRAVAAGHEDQVAAITFAGQMLALVAMDGQGAAVRPALSWLDHRADEEARGLTRRLGGATVVRAIAGATPTGKDIVAKVAWLARHEPESHQAAAFYGDATSYLVACATGRVALDPTAAGGTGMFHPAKRRWSPTLARLAGFPLDRMPPVVPSTEIAGRLHHAAAESLGLREGTPVAMGMADIPAAAVGSGALLCGEGHVYLGTSSWVAVTLAEPRHLPRAGIVSVPSAHPSRSLMIAESETAGVCRDWVGGQLQIRDLDHLAAQAPAGCDGLLFCPWMFGERAPRPDTELRGAFVGLTLHHTRAHLARAVLEGVALNLRWILEEIDRTGLRQPGLRVIGGGARSDLWLRILADVLGEPVTRIGEPRFAGAFGAAVVGAVATGVLPDLDSVRDRVRVDRVFSPEAPGRYDAAARRLRALAPMLSRAARLR